MRQVFLFTACCMLIAACGGSPGTTSPSSVPRLSRTRILAFGDSLTAGEVTAPVGVVPGHAGTGLLHPPNTRMIVVSGAAYPTQLLAMLQSRYSSQASAISIVNAGESNERAQEGVTRMPTVLSDSQADVLLLMQGVNDLRIAGPDLSAGFVEEMVRIARSQTRVFVGSMIPTLPGRRSSQVVSQLERLNSNLRSMAAAEGAVFVDLYSAMLPDAATLIGVDGLHPTEAGYRRIAELFFAAIQANLEVK